MVAARSLLAGLEAGARQLQEVWSGAREAGIVTGPLDYAVGFVLDGLGIEGRDVEAVRKMYATRELARLIRVQEVQDRVFAAGLERIYREGGEEYRERVLAWARRFGAEGVKFDRQRAAAVAALLGDLARTFLKSTVARPAHLAGKSKILSSSATVEAYPYLAIETAGDDRVRRNHAAMQGFVARADWAGWELEALPPYGYNCRCMPVPVSWRTAKRRGWSGTFPLGTSKLAAFRRRGGSDEGFPRGLFVLGAAAA